MTGAKKRPLAWITGARGLLGGELVRTAEKHAPAWEVRGLGRKELDLSNPGEAESLFRQESPGLVIHCAAMARLAMCEDDPALARRINVDATARLAELAAGIPLIFFSTDLVFDGLRGNYSEGDAVNPLTVYSETKVAAEKAVLANPAHTVVRTSLNYGHSSTGDRAFNEDLCRIWRDGKASTLFQDEFRSPIAAEVTAQAVWELVERKAAGLFHLAGSERLSRLEIGRAIAALVPELNPKIEAGSLRGFPGPPRSPDTSLNCGKVQGLLSFPLPRFTEWIAKNGRNRL